MFGFPRRDHRHQLKVGEDDEPLASIAHGAEPPRAFPALGALIRHVAEIPMIAVLAPVGDAHGWLERTLKPSRRDDAALPYLTAIEQHLSDAGEIARPHAEPAREIALPIAADAPFRWADPKRVKQDGTRIVVQRSFNAVLDNLPDQRGRTAAIDPMLARNRDDRLLQRIAITRSEEHTSELQSPCNLVCR